MSRELLLRLRDALDACSSEEGPEQHDLDAARDVLADLDAALEAPEPEPVAWMYTSKLAGNQRYITRHQTDLSTYKADKVWPLYAAPAQLAAQPNPCAKILEHKWLDPRCVENGCQSLAAPARVPLPFSKAQLHRLYVNSPELHKDAASEASFTRIVQLAEAAHGIGGSNAA